MALHRFEFRAMGGPNSVQVHAASAADAESAAATAIAEVLRIEAKYSRFRDDSLLSRIVAAAGGPPVAIDVETELLFAYAATLFRQSGGLFDVTVGSQSNLGSDPNNELGSDPKFETSPGRVRLPRAGTKLDFGGFGKEYAADRAAWVLREAGIESALVELGGDLVALGPQPGGEPWQVGVRHPRRDDAIIATIELSSGALATSGDYERFTMVDGERRHHIVDPRTGRSTRGFASVTVIGPNATTAGSGTTIAMLKGEAGGLAWLHELGLRYLAVTGDGRVLEGP